MGFRERAGGEGGEGGRFMVLLLVGGGGEGDGGGVLLGISPVCLHSSPGLFVARDLGNTSQGYLPVAEGPKIGAGGPGIETRGLLLRQLGLARTGGRSRAHKQTRIGLYVVGRRNSETLRWTGRERYGDCNCQTCIYVYSIVCHLISWETNETKHEPRSRRGALPLGPHIMPIPQLVFTNFASSK